MEWNWEESEAEESDDHAETPPRVLNRLERLLLWGSYAAFVATLAAAGLVYALKVWKLTGFPLIATYGVSLAIAWPVVRYIWRFIQRDRFLAGLSTSGLGWITLPILFVVGVSLSARDGCSGPHDTVGATPSDEQAPQQLEALQAESVRIEAASPQSTAVTNQRFSECLDELARREGARNQVNEVVTAILNPSLPITSAQQVVYDTLVDVCLKHSATPVRDVGPYFGSSLRNLRWKQYREALPGDSCSIEEIQWAEDPTAFVDLRHAMCELSRRRPELASVLVERAQGYSNREIAQRFGISESLVGNRVQEGRDELSTLLERPRTPLR